MNIEQVIERDVDNSSLLVNAYCRSTWMLTLCLIRASHRSVFCRFIFSEYHFPAIIMIYEYAVAH